MEDKAGMSSSVAKLMTLAEQCDRAIYGNKPGLLVWEGQEQGASREGTVRDFSVSHLK